MVRRYLVTGGSGFIGSHFIKWVLRDEANEIEVVNVDKMTYAASERRLAGLKSDSRYRMEKGDIGDMAFIADLFSDYDFDVVVNFAAESHVDRSIEDPAPFIESNIRGASMLLDVVSRCWGIGSSSCEGRLFVQASTDEVYGPVRKGSFGEGDPLNPSSPYAASKASADLMALSYWKTHGLPVCIVRSCNVFGPLQHPEKLIPKAMLCLEEGRPVPLYGDGECFREWMYVEDECRAFETVIACGVPGEVYNASSGFSLSNKTLVQLLASFAGCADRAPLVSYVADRKGHDRRYAVDSSKLRALGWLPACSLEEGLALTFRGPRLRR